MRIILINFITLIFVGCTSSRWCADHIDCQDERFSSSKLYYQSFSSDLLIEFLRIHNTTYGYVKMLSRKIKNENIILVVNGTEHHAHGTLQKEGYIFTFAPDTMNLLLESLAHNHQVKLFIDDQFFTIDLERFTQEYKKFQAKYYLSDFAPTNLR